MFLLQRLSSSLSVYGEVESTKNLTANRLKNVSACSQVKFLSELQMGEHTHNPEQERKRESRTEVQESYIIPDQYITGFFED